jgi:hypothetical protein
LAGGCDVICAGLGRAVHCGKLHLRRNSGFAHQGDLEKRLLRGAFPFRNGHVVDAQDGRRFVARDRDRLAILGDRGIHGLAEDHEECLIVLIQSVGFDMDRNRFLQLTWSEHQSAP